MKNYILSILIIIPFFVLSQTDEKVISDIYTNSLTGCNQTLSKPKFSNSSFVQATAFSAPREPESLLPILLER